MKSRLQFLTMIILALLNRVANGQNPAADFRCSTISFDTTTHVCCIGFEDFSRDSDGSVLSQVWDFGDPASGNSNSSAAHFVYHYYSSIGLYTVVGGATNLPIAMTIVRATQVLTGTLIMCMLSGAVATLYASAQILSINQCKCP